MDSVIIDLLEHEKFHVARRRAGVTQADVASACGIARGRLIAYEAGSGLLDDALVERLWSALPAQQSAAQGSRGGNAA